MARTTSSLTSWTIGVCLVTLFAVTFAYAPTRQAATADDQHNVMSWVGAHAWAEMNCPAHKSDPSKLVRVQADDLRAVGAYFDDVRNHRGLTAACNTARALTAQTHSASISAATADQRNSAVHADIAHNY